MPYFEHILIDPTGRIVRTVMVKAIRDGDTWVSPDPGLYVPKGWTIATKVPGVTSVDYPRSA
jgi:hypothetical protein